MTTETTQKTLFTEPSGATRLVGYEIDPFAVMTDVFGARFTDYRRAWQSASNLEEIPEFPLSLDLEQNATCNLSCVMCPMGSKNYQNPMADHPMMDMDLYRSLIDEGESYALPAMTFGFLSEPLLRRDVADMVAYARQKGVMDIRLGTNATMLTKTRSRELIDAGLTRLEVSIDAATPETFAKIRRGANFHIVTGNVLAFLELRKSQGAAFPLLRMSFLRTGLNERELDDFLGFWRGKADFFSIQEMVYYETADIKPHQTAAKKKSAKKFACPEPFQRVIVRSNGDVHPCCSVYGMDLKLGNALQKSIHSMWHGRRVSEIRELHKSGNYDRIPACEKCAREWGLA